MRVLLSMGRGNYEGSPEKDEGKIWNVPHSRAKGKYVEHSRRGRGNIEFSPVGRRDL